MSSDGGGTQLRGSGFCVTPVVPMLGSAHAHEGTSTVRTVVFSTKPYDESETFLMEQFPEDKQTNIADCVHEDKMIKSTQEAFQSP